MAQLPVRGQAAMAQEDEEGEQQQQQGVLLYYKFVSVPDPDQVRQWFQDLCSSLALLGRVRVAPDGVNVTVGGTMVCLRKHISAVEQHPLFNGCDFKLAESSNPINANSKLAVECGFDSLSVRLVKELVTLGLHPSLTTPSIKNAGKHLLPQEFHQILQIAGTASANGLHGHSADCANTECKFLHVKESTAGDSLRCNAENMSTNPNCGVVLLDARNIYETRIGRFSPPAGVELMESFSRQYSDLPVWIDQNADRLHNKQILMYCTGGVRCEMASAYIRSKGEGFEDVFQLSGGIQRYLEAYPNGGFFKGKNFVFDYRVAVPSSSNEVVASCLACGISFDDYSSRTRCCKCRMLILICPSCQVMVDTQTTKNLACSYICELCKKQDKGVAVCNLAADDGYTECGENDKKWTVQGNVDMPACKVPVSNPCHTCLSRRKLRILCLHGFRQNASNLKGRLASLSKKLKHGAEFIFVNAPHELPFIYHSQHSTLTAAACGDVVTDENKEAVDTESLPHIWKKKYAWLIGPTNQTDMDSNEMTSHKNQYWISRKHAFDPLQYQTQTEGWPESWIYLQRIFSELGPFDGVLGFSQGAAVAAALCPLISRTGFHHSSVRFKFVILCSGFPSPVNEHKSMMPQLNDGPLLDCPSLHIFCGSSGYDRQIAVDESENLASMFTRTSSVIVQHSSGHMIPTQPEYLQQYMSFLNQFQ